MTAPDTTPAPPKPPLPFAGDDAELEKMLLEFARLTGGWTARDPKRKGWTVFGGAWFSTNPNTVARTTCVARVDGGLVLTTVNRPLPWAAPKFRRIAEFREGQLADYLTARVRGLGPEKFDAQRLREPFSPYGAGVAAITASYAWTVLTGLATFAFTFAFAALSALPLMSLAIQETAAHSTELARAGAVPLPSVAEAAAAGPLGPAIVFAFPIAFLAALLHTAGLVACDLGVRTARVPQATFLFVTALLTFAYYPFFPWLALPLALSVSLGAPLGATLVWGRRRERVREGAPPRKAAVLIAVMLAAALAGAAVPHAVEWKDAMNRIALFRDRFLLGNGLGKAIAETYCRCTLYTAEPIKELYSLDDRRTTRAQPIAGCDDPATTLRLRALHFTVVSSTAASDVVVGPGGISSGRDLAELKSALDDYSRRTFRGGPLREVCSQAWRSLYYSGPLVALLVLMGLFAPGVSILFRKLPPRLAVFSLAALAMVTSLTLLLLEPAKDGNADLASMLQDESPALRHEAAYRASLASETSSLAEALLKTADDSDFRVRLWACAALGKSGDARALPKLLERLDDPEMFVRYRAAEGLGFLRNPKAVDPLLQVMRERSWYEGSYALDALRHIQPERF